MPRSVPPTASQPTTPADVLRQVRRIELRTRRLVDSRLSGDYHSVFKGQGIEFAEVREYLPGDDVRAIDWNVTARLGQPYVKKFVEERELTVLLVADFSGSQQWGVTGRFKADLLTEVAATLAMSAVRNNDRVGLVTFTDRVEAVVPPRKGRRHAMRLVRDLLRQHSPGSGTDAAAALRFAERVLPSRSVVFLFSDFQFGAGWDAFERVLTTATARHDIIPLILVDPREVELPPVGLLRLRDPETGAIVVVDSSSARVRERYAKSLTAERERARRLFRRLAIDAVELLTDQPFAAPLLAFFRRRERRLRG